MNGISWRFDLCQWLLLPIHLTSHRRFDCVVRVSESVLLINRPFFITITLPRLLAPSLDTALWRSLLFNTPLTLHAGMPSNLITLS